MPTIVYIFNAIGELLEHALLNVVEVSVVRRPPVIRKAARASNVARHNPKKQLRFAQRRS